MQVGQILTIKLINIQYVRNYLPYNKPVKAEIIGFTNFEKTAIVKIIGHEDKAQWYVNGDFVIVHSKLDPRLG